jgi:hypothetical protein
MCTGLKRIKSVFIYKEISISSGHLFNLKIMRGC